MGSANPGCSSPSSTDTDPSAAVRTGEYRLFAAMVTVYPRLRTDSPIPRPGIVGVADGEGRVAELERTERVEHHRELLGPVDVPCELDAAGLGAVHEAGGMETHRTRRDSRSRAAHEIPARVEEHLVGVDIRVVIRDL